MDTIRESTSSANTSVSICDKREHTHTLKARRSNLSTNNDRRLAALQYRDFRLMWGGNFVSVVGSQMQMVAINWHVYRLLAGTTHHHRSLRTSRSSWVQRRWG